MRGGGFLTIDHCYSYCFLEIFVGATRSGWRDQSLDGRISPVTTTREKPVSPQCSCWPGTLCFDSSIQQHCLRIQNAFLKESLLIKISKPFLMLVAEDQSIQPQNTYVNFTYSSYRQITWND